MRRRPAAATTPEASVAGLHVVVVGGGFGGLTLVRELARARRSDHLGGRVTLVDRHNHHTFQPLLYQVATAGLQPQDVGISLRAILRRHGTEVRLGEVVGIDPQRQRLALDDGSALDYDRLVLAAGAITEDFGVPGVAEHAFGLKSLAEATTLRNEVLRRFEEVSADPARATDGSLTIVVAGGGPTGSSSPEHSRSSSTWSSDATTRDSTSTRCASCWSSYATGCWAGSRTAPARPRDAACRHGTSRSGSVSASPGRPRTTSS
jgi:glycine/D-amino acid oxidase-like deaminating enzyme